MTTLFLGFAPGRINAGRLLLSQLMMLAFRVVEVVVVVVVLVVIVVVGRDFLRSAREE